MRDYLQKLKAWHHNAALLEAKTIFSNGLKRNRKICKAWQHDTQNSLNKCISPLQHKSHSDNSFLLICIEEFKLCFVGNQQSCSSFTFSSAFLQQENPFVVLVWQCTFEIIHAMEGDKSLENVTCFVPSALLIIQTTRAQDEVERHGKLIASWVKQDAFKEQFETSIFTSSSQLLIARLRIVVFQSLREVCRLNLGHVQCFFQLSKCITCPSR